MMEFRFKRSLLLTGLLLSFHVVLGLYAVYDGGFFIYGLTAPERMLYHAVSGGESHITLSGAAKHIAGDLCLQPCLNCPMDCYRVGDLKLVCGEECTLVTGKNTVLATEGDVYTAVLKKGLLFSDVTFRCYDGDCGFDVRLDDERTFSTRLQDEITSS